MRAFHLVLCLTVGCFSGCGRNAPTPDGVGPGRAAPKEDQQKVLRDLTQALNKATDVEHFRQALPLADAVLGRHAQPPRLSEDDRAFLKDAAQLTGEELTMVGASACQRGDAPYLASAYFFRTVAAALDLADAATLDRAQAAFSWVMRRVDLHEQGDVYLPPALVARRGYGNARDRALVFLELARALDLQAGVLTGPGDVVLIGVVLGQGAKKDLALFDPRLGLPVAGADGQGVATLAQVRAKPGLLSNSGLAKEEVAKLEVRAAAPLEALSLRMQCLEKELASQDQIRLYQNLCELTQSLSAAAAAPVKVWTAPPPSPLRRARLFYAADDGGLDIVGRHEAFKSRLVPRPGVRFHFRRMNLDDDLLPSARDMLLAHAEELLLKFYQQPEELFLRGRHEAVFARLSRLRDELDTALPDDREFPKHVAQWRETVNAKYVRAQQQAPNADADLNKLWEEDQFILALLKGDEDLKPYRKSRGTLSHILFAACREQLAQQSAQLIADCWHEQAAVAQAALERQRAAGQNPDPRPAAQAWDNARGAWIQFLDRLQQGGARLAAIHVALRNQEIHTAISLAEENHRDLHAAWRGRWLLAQAQALSGKPDARRHSRATLQFLHDELTKTLKEDEVSKALSKLRSQAHALNQPHLIARLDLMLRDWTPQGHVHWLEQTVRVQLAALKE